MSLFTKNQRLLKKREYDAVFQKAKKIVTTHFIVMVRENELGYARLGLAISKKAVAQSHDRNRIKRLIRESFRESLLPALDIIFLARRGVDQKENTVIFAELTKIWLKLVSFSKK